ncbi:hypothetical protein [Rhizobium sp. PL01]|uniref:hypothetical protein n=1 Tax=Rhizobium sp. PL01 TaxID=3085631 RepID=UPI002981FB64|nr:hypothetical protein [Rhizobium sp. PL01]MDW5313431.1 hypothetical protein [Rhizobium sp. PL01]
MAKHMKMAPRKLAVGCIIFTGPFSSLPGFYKSAMRRAESLRCWSCLTLKHRHFFYATAIVRLFELTAEMQE